MAKLHSKDDLLNKIFGRLKVISDLPLNKHGKRQWLCLCECGNKKIIPAKVLKSGESNSCGCYNREINSNRYIHRKSNSKEYHAWENMKARGTM